MMACASDSPNAASPNAATSSSIFIAVEQRNRICVLRCVGRFVSGPQVEYMQSRLNEVKRLRCTRVVADFRGVSAIGSMGLGFLVGLYTSIVDQSRVDQSGAGQSGSRFVVAGAIPLVRAVLDLTHLDTVIPLAPDLAAGLKLVGADSATVDAFSEF
jgi:anti-anti-sigma regulatory factor